MISPADQQNRSTGQLRSPSGIPQERVAELSGALNVLLADVFVLYVKTKNFHWHMSGPHFRDYHLLLDDQGAQIFPMTDDLAKRVRKIGGRTLRSVGQICRLQRLTDNDADLVTPHDMLSELANDNTCSGRLQRNRMTSEHRGRPAIYGHIKY